MLMTRNYRICLLFFTALALSGCRPFYTASTRMNLDKADSISTALLPFFNLQEQRHEYSELEQLCDLLAEEDLSAIDKRKVNLYRIQSTLNSSINAPMDQKTAKMLDRCMRSRSRDIVQLATLIDGEWLFCHGEYEQAMDAISGIPLPIAEYSSQDSAIFSAARLLEARIAIRRRDHETGTQMLELARDMLPSAAHVDAIPFLAGLKIRSLVFLDRSDEAIRLFKSTAPYNSPDSVGLRRVSEILRIAFKTGVKDSKLLALCIEVEKSMPQERQSQPSAIAQLAYDIHSSGRSQEAMAYTAETISRYPQNAGAVHLMAQLCRLTGDHEGASEYYEKYTNLTSENGVINSQRIREAEQLRINRDIDKRIVSLRRTVSLVAFLSIAAILSIAGAIIGYLIHKKRRLRYEADIRQQQLIKKVILGTVSTVPDLVSGITNTANLSTRYSPEIYEKLNGILDDYKKQCRNNIIQLVADESIMLPEIRQYMDELSPQEKVIAMLFQEGISTQDISRILGISANNIRMNRSRIRRKIQEKYPEASEKLRILASSPEGGKNQSD